MAEMEPSALRSSRAKPRQLRLEIFLPGVVACEGRVPQRPLMAILPRAVRRASPYKHLFVTLTVC